MNLVAVIRGIITICALFSFCILKNFVAGSLFVFTLLIVEFIEFRKAKKKSVLIVTGVVFLFCLILTLTYR